MTLKKTFSTLLLAAILCAPFTISAQVTIGSDRPPSEWSLLDLDNSERVRNNEQPKALHLPRLTDDDRDDLNLEATAGPESPARGLMIFNTDNECVEFWSGTHWISLCEGDTPPFITPPHWNTACRENPAFADCFAELRRFNSTVRQLADGTPRNISHATISAINFNMMPVTGGAFYMGDQDLSDDIPNRDPDSQGTFFSNFSSPVHQVGVSSFYMAQTQVTRALWRAVMAQEGDFVVRNVAGDVVGTANLTEITFIDPSTPASTPATDGAIAMNHVRWFYAVVFANRLSVILGRVPVYSFGSATFTLDDLRLNAPLPTSGTVTKVPGANGFRLPTEAEWEYAARGGQQNNYTRTLGARDMRDTQFRFSGSNTVGDVAWYSGNSGGQVHPVATRPQSNQLGIYDMSGNVFEWVWDWAHSPHSPPCCAVNPTGSVSGTNRVVRGGSWEAPASQVRVSHRASIPPASHGSMIGFRLASSSVE